jgi:fructose-1,6-bisphosphatase II
MNTVCCVLGRMEEQTSRCSFSGDSHFIYDKVYKTQDLIDSDDVFFAATGVSSGELLKGVRYFSGGAQTQSIAMRCRSGTVRWIDAWHNFDRLDKLSSFELH